MTGSEFRNYVVSTFVRTDKDDEIYEATTDMVKFLVASYPFDDFKKITTDATISSGNSFALPSDFVQFVSDITCVDSDSAWKLIKVDATTYEREHAWYAANSNDNATPRIYCVIDGNVYVSPRPDSYSYTYRYVYEYQITTDIDSSTANVPFTENYRKMLKHYVLGALYQDLENFELASSHMATANDLYNTIVRVDKNNTEGITRICYRDI